MQLEWSYGVHVGVFVRRVEHSIVVRLYVIDEHGHSSVRTCLSLSHVSRLHTNHTSSRLPSTNYMSLLLYVNLIENERLTNSQF